MKWLWVYLVNRQEPLKFKAAKVRFSDDLLLVNDEKGEIIAQFSWQFIAGYIWESSK